jgi:hypothetical protein
MRTEFVKDHAQTQLTSVLFHTPSTPTKRPLLAFELRPLLSVCVEQGILQTRKRNLAKSSSATMEVVVSKANLVHFVTVHLVVTAQGVKSQADLSEPMTGPGTLHWKCVKSLI